MRGLRIPHCSSHLSCIRRRKRRGGGLNHSTIPEVMQTKRGDKKYEKCLEESPKDSFGFGFGVQWSDDYRKTQCCCNTKIICMARARRDKAKRPEYASAPIKKTVCIHGSCFLLCPTVQ